VICILLESVRAEFISLLLSCEFLVVISTIIKIYTSFFVKDSN